jgi:alkylresorcinol/alkylpyrone synthase
VYTQPTSTMEAPRPHATSGTRACIAGTATALAPHHYSQRELAALAAQYLPDGSASDGVIERFFARVGVDDRYLALPVERYRELRGLGERNDAWLEVATELGESVVRRLLDETGLAAEDVGLLATTTVTGIAVPSLDARLMNRLPFRRSLKRMPLFGLGCLGGAAGLSRVTDYLRGAPTEAAILLSVELCSLTFQPHDGSVANIVSTGLFGDGAAAVLLVGAQHPLASRALGPSVVDTRSVFFPDSERVMGWDVVDSGFRVVLSADVAKVVARHVPAAVDGLLDDHALTRDDVDAWIVHPGGPKVIDAIVASLALPESALEPTRRSLRRVGNLSSSSVLFLLDERRRTPPALGAYGLLMAMGPAFCSEMVLLSW